MLGRLGLLIGFMSGLLWGQNQSRAPDPTYTVNIARQHEEPHRLFIPIEGVDPGWHPLRFTLAVSPAGDVVDAIPWDGDEEVLKFWPQVEGEIRHWKFTPFQENGRAVAAHVEELVILIPAEQSPKTRATTPSVLPDSKVEITLNRSGGYWGGPTYTVTVGTGGIVFDGRAYVVASGKHTDTVDAGEVRKLARRFVDANFYSMNEEYVANNISDLPSSLLSISIDGYAKRVKEYGGSAVGMPGIVRELEETVDAYARTQRWVNGNEGLIEVLQREKFNFQSFETQVMLKEAASRGALATVREFLKAGVPLEPLPLPKPSGSDISPFGDLRNIRAEEVGWLRAASNRPDVLQVFLDAGANKDDQEEKNRALADAASAGNLKSVQKLIAYGASINAETNSSHGDKRSMLILAAELKGSL